MDSYTEQITSLLGMIEKHTGAPALLTTVLAASGTCLVRVSYCYQCEGSLASRTLDTDVSVGSVEKRQDAVLVLLRRSLMAARADEKVTR